MPIANIDPAAICGLAQLQGDQFEVRESLCEQADISAMSRRGIATRLAYLIAILVGSCAVVPDSCTAANGMHGCNDLLYRLVRAGHIE